MDGILNALIVSLCALVLMMTNLFKHKKEDKKIYTAFIVLCITFVIHLGGLILQRLFINSYVNPIYFDYITYIGGSFTPLIFFIISKVYQNSKVNIKRYKWMVLIPLFFIVLVLTNDLHHLFYIKYDVNYADTVFGPILYMFAVYSYSLYVATMIILARKSIRNSGIFSIQTILIIVGMLIPLLGNFLGIMNIIDSNIYLSPILLIITSICFYISIFKLKALNVIPIATKTIIDNMTDSFIVISEDGTIADINKTCIEKFAPLMELKQNDNLYDKLKGKKTLKLEDLKNDIKEAIDKKSTITKEYHIQKNEYDKYFEVDIQPIKAKSGNEYVAMLLLIRDVTQAKKDIEIITKNENLVILGELAGGVAHDINTPISAIKSGVTMLKTVSKSEDEQMLLSSMDRCADKIIALVNSLRNQIRNIGSDTVTDISITNTLSDIKLILNNELKKNNVELVINTENEINLKGNPTKLSQVITNIVTNAIQAYDKQGGKVEVTVKEEKNNAVIFVKDYASGIPESVRPYIFKNILTTKGVSGTGFGLYLAYSVIKGAFGGDITFETETGKGTTFIISIPIK